MQACSCSGRAAPSSTTGGVGSSSGSGVGVSSSTTSTSASAGVQRQRQQRQQHQRRSVRANATDPAALQDVIVGGAVASAVGAALFSGLKKDPQPCAYCAGNGGALCFACSGAGSAASSMASADDDDGGLAAARPPRRDPIGRSPSGRPGSCRVCKGTGLVLCRKCNGSGYV